MARRKVRPVSFDAMIKLFMQKYQIPTKKDLEKLSAKLDLLEKRIKESAASAKRRKYVRKVVIPAKAPMTATEAVLDVIEKSRVGASFSKIQEVTGFQEKKLRNIIFRMSKLGKIERVERGVYKTA